MLWEGAYIEATLSNHLRMHFRTTLILVFAVCLGAKEIVSYINICLWLTGRQSKPFSFSGSHELSLVILAKLGKGEYSSS